MDKEIYNEIFIDMILDEICNMICENEGMYVYDYEGYKKEFKNNINIQNILDILNNLCLQP